MCLFANKPCDAQIRHWLQWAGQILGLGQELLIDLTWAVGKLSNCKLDGVAYREV